MHENEFWDLIEKHITTDDEGLPEIDGLEEELCGRRIEDILAFDKLFTRYHSESYSCALWGAAYLINGGCSDDGFDYFRGWLIAMGRKVYDGALEDPDTLASVAEEHVECEDILYVASRAYEAVTNGQDMPQEQIKYPELGEDWDFDNDDEMCSRYPKLFEKFGEV